MPRKFNWWLSDNLQQARSKFLQIFFKFFRYVFIKLLNLRVINRIELKRLARTEGKLIEYGEPTTFEIDLPDSSIGTIPDFEEKSGPFRLPQPFTAELNDVLLVGKYPFPIYNKNVIWDAIVSRNVATMNLYKSLFDIGSFFRQEDTISEGVLLLNAWNGGYFHWVAETLTRLEGVEAYKDETGNSPKLIVGEELNKFQRRTLEMLGYSSDDLIHWSGGRTRVNKLVVPSMRREMNNNTNSPIAVDWLNQKLAPQSTELPDSKRIYISRADADSRRVVNEEEIVELLESYGFKRILPSKLDPSETIHYFANAEVIVGPHGAGLTDIIFSRDAAVIEFHRGEQHTRVYWMLSKEVGNWYGYIKCLPEDEDLYVDPNDLEDMIEHVLYETSF